MYDNLQPIFIQKTCPDLERVFTTLGASESKIQNQDKTMPYPMV